MTRQLVKKSRTDKRKRKGYKGTKWDTAKTIGKGAIGTGVSYGIWDLITNVLNALPSGKHGGRVTKRGIGKATHGFGKVMRKN